MTDVILVLLAICILFLLVFRTKVRDQFDLDTEDIRALKEGLDTQQNEIKRLEAKILDVERRLPATSG